MFFKIKSVKIYIMNKVFIIRHAESQTNIGGIFEHKNIVKLTENGKKQAEKLSETLKKPNKIIVSKYIRTIETAEPFIKKFPNSEVELWIDVHEFDYINPARHINITLKEREKMMAEYWQRKNPFYKESLDVESFVEFIERVNIVILKLKKLPPGINYIFSHGNFIRMLLLLLSEYNNFNSLKHDETFYEKIMQRYEIFLNDTSIDIYNTAIFDVTQKIKNYKNKTVHKQ